ncbi:MAG: hypothetical protein HOV81_28545 [Kofleriaceae bacterium]|nr:hypothetical protein [Kofleriaceae bacterium]
MADDGAFERVYTMTDYYDGPRAGIASFQGKPYAYTCPFDHWKDGFADLYELRAVDDETLRLALEDWEIWLRWDDAYQAGQVDLSTHPALPADRPRHDEITPVLAARFAGLPDPAIRARGAFRPSPGHDHAGGGRWMEVRWTVA